MSDAGKDVGSKEIVGKVTKWLLLNSHIITLIHCATCIPL